MTAKTTDDNNRNPNLEFAAFFKDDLYTKRWIEDKIEEYEKRNFQGNVSIPKELLITDQEKKELDEYWKKYDTIINKLKQQSKYIK